MIALTILMNEFLVKVQNSSVERRNRVSKSFSGHSLLCPGHSLLCPGHSLLCPGHFLLCTGHFLLCPGHSLLCSGALFQNSDTAPLKRHLRADMEGIELNMDSCTATTRIGNYWPLRPYHLLSINSHSP